MPVYELLSLSVCNSKWSDEMKPRVHMKLDCCVALVVRSLLNN